MQDKQSDRGNEVSMKLAKVEDREHIVNRRLQVQANRARGLFQRDTSKRRVVISAREVPDHEARSPTLPPRRHSTRSTLNYSHYFHPMRRLGEQALGTRLTSHLVYPSSRLHWPLQRAYLPHGNLTDLSLNGRG
ncbi:hypothetical protein QCA50_010855 [Cerrena zonata]|uniref:Uncharacterized protein n=1 Tax=Cerrena zonata TaxID=2478898 RepID=A0AAW0G7R1_9APHY